MKEGDLISSLLELKNGYLVLSLLNSNLAWPGIVMREFTDICFTENDLLVLETVDHSTWCVLFVF